MTSTPTPEPERQWVCHKPGWMGPCSPQSTHHNGFDWGCGWIYFPAPSTPGEGDGRPGGWVEGIGWVALLYQLRAADHFTYDVERSWEQDPWEQEYEPLPDGEIDTCTDLVIVTRWADGITPAPPASPVPPTPTPCPYIVTGGEGTSYCSLAERSAMHAAVPPTPTPQADGTGQALKSMAIELAVERRRASLATVALLNACRDGWADGDSAAAKYLAEAELAAAPPSTPADPRPTDLTGSEA